MRKIRLYLMPLVAIALMCMGQTARADTITLILTDAGQSVIFSPTMDQTLQFIGTLSAPGTNTDTLDLGDSYNVDSPLTLDDSQYGNLLFPLGYPALGPGDSVTGDLFNVTVPADTSAGLYTGTFTIQGIGENTQEYVDDTAGFNVAVDAPASSVPEPPTFLLLGVGLVALAAFGFKKVGRARTV